MKSYFDVGCEHNKSIWIVYILEMNIQKHIKKLYLQHIYVIPFIITCI